MTACEAPREKCWNSQQVVPAQRAARSESTRILLMHRTIKSTLSCAKWQARPTFGREGLFLVSLRDVEQPFTARFEPVFSRHLGYVCVEQRNRDRNFFALHVRIEQGRAPVKRRLAALRRGCSCALR